MAGFGNIYNTQTIRIMNELYSCKYDDPLVLRSALEKCELFSFAQELWQAILTRFPCRLYLDVLERCRNLEAEGRSFEAAGELFARNKSALWSRYCSEAGSAKNTTEFVSAFFRETCRSNPLCRPCSCKKHLTDFFEQISGESHDSVKKNINNWLSGHSRPNTREGYIQLCYALGLRVFRGEAVNNLDANRFLSFSCGQNPLYLRSAQEAIHYFCLMRPFGKVLSPEDDYDAPGNYSYARSLQSRLEKLPPKAADNKGYTIESRLLIDSITDENELLDFISGHAESNSERYYSACRLLEKFCEEYELLEHDMEEEEEGGKKKKPLTKGTAIQIVDIFSRVSTDRKSIKMLRDFISDGYSLSDALYRSDVVLDMSKGLQTVSRSVLLLTALSLNYGTAYDVRSGRMRNTLEFDECTSFNSFCRTVSAILESCNMAMIYPRRKFDFLVLHSYMSMTRDINRRGIAEALSDYLLRTMELIGSSED